MQISFGLLEDGKFTPTIDIGEWEWKRHARIKMDESQLRALADQIATYLARTEVSQEQR